MVAASPPDMPLAELNSRFKHLLDADRFCGLAGLANFSSQDWLIVQQHFFVAAGSVDRLIWLSTLHPAVAVVGMSRAAMIAYGDNFWPNFCREIRSDVPVGKRADLTNAFCRAAERCLSGFRRANWDAWKLAGEFLAQAGLPLDRCGTFSRILRLAVNETGLPEPADADMILEVVERMLQRSELHGQTIIQKALRGPAGPVLVEAAVAAITDEDYDRFNPELGKALHEAFENLPRQESGQTIRRPYLQINRDFTSLEIHVPYPAPSLVGGNGLLWSVDGERYRVPHLQSLEIPLSKLALVPISLSGLANGRTLAWTLDAIPSAWSKEIAAFDTTSRRLVRADTTEAGISLPPGDYALLHPLYWQCDEAETQSEWSDLKLGLTMICLRPGQEYSFYADDAEVRLTSSRFPWLEHTGKVFATTDGETRIHYGWQNWPRLWIPADTNPNHWSLEISINGKTVTLHLTATGEMVGGLSQCEANDASLLNELSPGIHRVSMIARLGKRARLKRDWLYWAGLLKADEDSICWHQAPANMQSSSVRGFEESENGLKAVRAHDSNRSVSFTMADGELVTLRWRKQGLTLESCEVSVGHRSVFAVRSLGTAFPADEFSKTRLRISAIPAQNAELLVNGSVFKKVSSLTRAVQFDVSLASLAALHREGGKIEMSVGDSSPRFVAAFRPPVVATAATIVEQPPEKDGRSFRQLRLLLTSKPEALRIRVRELLSGSEILVEGKPPQSQSVPAGSPFEALNQIRPETTDGGPKNLWFNSEGLPALKGMIGLQKRIGQEVGWQAYLSAPREGWKRGVWWLELECRAANSPDWVAVRDVKGGRLPIIVVRNVLQQTAEDYRSQALWLAFADRAQDGFRPSELWPADGNQEALLSCYEEVCSMLTDRVGTVSWRQMDGLIGLVGRLAGQVSHLLSHAHEGAASTCVARLNQEVNLADPRSVLALMPGVLALNPSWLAQLTDGDHFRTCLRWCGLLCAAESPDLGFCRLEMEAGFSCGTSCASPATLFGLFAQKEEGAFSGFNFRRYFEQLIHGKSNAGTEPASLIPLSMEHFDWALREFLKRRHNTEALCSVSNVNGILAKSQLVIAEIARRVQPLRRLMPQGIWQRPWPEINVENDAMAENLVKFASVYALAARLAGDKRMDFRDFSQWLRSQNWLGQYQKEAVKQTTTTLICQAPELLGFFLMFWQLMIQTYPHD